MKHLEIYESFEDSLSSDARDLFGLNHTIKFFDGTSISGPTETATKAESIGYEISSIIKFAQDLFNGGPSYKNQFRTAVEIEDRLRGDYESRLKEIGYKINYNKPAYLEQIAYGMRINVGHKSELAPYPPYRTDRNLTPSEFDEKRKWADENIQKIAKEMGATSILGDPNSRLRG